MTFSILGKDTDSNTVTVNQTDRREGTYIIGASGKGKSVLLLNLILEDIKQGLGVVVIDPNRDLIKRVIECIPLFTPNRLDDIILLDIANYDFPFGLNIYECANPTDPKAVQYVVDRVMHIWDRLFAISRSTPQMAQHMRNCAHVLIANQGYTMADIPLLFYDKNFRDRLVKNVTNPNVKLFWQNYENMPRLDRSRETSHVINKLDEFMQPMAINVVGQAKSTMNLRQIFDDRKILLLQLDPQLQATTSLLGSTLLAMILQAAYSRENLPPNKRKQVNVYIDELDYFATRDVQQIFQECRKFGVSLTMAHQSRVKLQNEVPELARGILGAATTVVFQITPPDSSELAGKFDTTPPEPKQEEVGTEEIRTSVKDVVQHLLHSGSHPNLLVNKFANGLLREFKIQDDRDRLHLVTDLNTILYESMIGNDVTQLVFSGRLAHTFGLSSMPGCSRYTLVFNPYEGIITKGDGSKEENPSVYIPARQGLQYLWSASANSWEEQQAIEMIDNSVKMYLRDVHLQELYNAINMAKDGRNIQQSWYYIDANLIEWEVIHNPSYPLNHSFPMTISRPKAGQEWKFYREADLMNFVKTEIAPGKKIFLNIINELKAVCQALAKEPIRIGNGQYIKNMRPGQKKSHTERQNEIANMLSGLPKLTARVKLNAFPQNLQSKVCHCCGKPKLPTAKFCNICGIRIQPEYTIAITPNNQRMKPVDLQARIDTITQKNVADGYLRPRADVEAEILARQQPPPPPAQPQPAQPKPKTPPQSPAGAVTQPPATPTPRKRVIGTPITKQCPSCNAQNTPTALFCNMCGSTL